MMLGFIRVFSFIIGSPFMQCREAAVRSHQSGEFRSIHGDAKRTWSFCDNVEPF